MTDNILMVHYINHLITHRSQRETAYIKTRATIVPVELHNEAGIIGAAVLASEG